MTGLVKTTSYNNGLGELLSGIKYIYINDP